jgi:YebC/PmpR family DNA-binding regulatory protein
MAGHSHWARIKRQKGAADAKRGRIFSKLARAIISAARQGGGDPAANLKLRYAIDEARAENMPKDSIERAIRRGTGEEAGAHFEEVTYEGYARGGVAVLVETLTDNRHRTGPELKKIFEKFGGNLGAAGSVAWMFDRKATFGVPAGAVPEDRLLEVGLEAGAEDVEPVEGGGFLVRADPSTFHAVREALDRQKVPVESAEIGYLPRTTVTIDASVARSVLNLMHELEENEDVQKTHANFEIPASVLEEIGKA